MILAIHLPLSVTAPIAIIAAVVLAWYWFRLGDGDVPRSRRRLRRASLTVMFVGLLLAVAGMSLVDARTQATAYVTIWIAVAAIAVIALFTALLDILNNVRLHQAHCEQRIEGLSRDVIRLARTSARGSSRERPSEDGPE